MDDSSKKPHYKRKAGPKARKKKLKNMDPTAKGSNKGNPKAFAIRSVQKTQKFVHRALDLKVKQHRVPILDRTDSENPPPVVVAIVGPQKVGKTTLMKALVRYYTHQNCTQPVGPISFVVNKTRRITLIESNNDLNSMIDIAKLADVILLMIDASFGFEMETFEFMNICQSFGMPKVIGVLTHLDMFSDSKRLKKRKKLLKHRFWTEIHAGAKMFYMTRFLNSHYSRTEIQKMARTLSVTNFHSVEFRSSHSYVVGDRVEDLTDINTISESDGKCDRKVAFFGYVRGGGNLLRKGASVHIAGCGDFSISSALLLNDPCPLPGNAKGRLLLNSERTIYAPMAGLGGLLYDADAIYVEESQSKQTDPLLPCLANADTLFDLAVNETQNEFIQGVYLNADESDDYDDYDEEKSQSSDQDLEECSPLVNNDQLYPPAKRANEDEAQFTSWSTNTQHGVISFQKEHANWNRLIYSDKLPETGLQNGVGGKLQQDVDCFDRPENNGGEITELNWESLPKEALANCFVTGKWNAAEDAQHLIKADDELYGDFEELGNNDIDDSGSDGEDSVEEGKDGDNESTVTKNIDEKNEAPKDRDERIRKIFDSKSNRITDDDKYWQSLKEETQKQSNLNRETFETMDKDERTVYEGYRPGAYVRIEVSHVPCEFIKHFDPSYPILLGVVQPIEEQIAYLQIRLKRHRWYSKILKTMDPLIFSIGWRRFQSQAVFATQDHNMRLRALKYSPKNLHCIATVYAPVTSHGTGVIAIQTLEPNERIGFRIAATGTVINCDKSYQVVKKLKLIGYPYQIYQKTAFIKGMFHSEMEVGRFEGVGIRTVSGIRGLVKRAIKSPDGAFRATFEDRILESDIVFMRTWHPVVLPKLYNSLRSNLLSVEERSKWKGMRTVGELRFLTGQTNSNFTQDSVYKPIERSEPHFPPLKIPKRVQGQLPFDSKPKVIRRPKDHVQSGRIAVVMDEKEKKSENAIDILKTLYKEKIEAKQAKYATYKQKVERENKISTLKFTQREKKLKKEFFRTLKVVKGKKVSGRRK